MDDQELEVPVGIVVPAPLKDTQALALRIELPAGKLGRQYRGTRQEDQQNLAARNYGSNFDDLMLRIR